MPVSAKVSLAQFEQYAREHPKKSGPTCSVCMLPPDLLTLIHEAKGRGHGPQIIARFLAENGHPQITRLRLHNHFEKGHHAKADSQGR